MLQLPFGNRGAHQGFAVWKVMVDRGLRHPERVCNVVEREVRKRRFREETTRNCDNFHSSAVATDRDAVGLRPSFVGSL